MKHVNRYLRTQNERDIDEVANVRFNRIDVLTKDKTNFELMNARRRDVYL